MKNCGSIVHDEIATKAFMEELRELIKSSKEENVKAKLLELLQTWGMAFRSNQKYRIVTVSQYTNVLIMKRTLGLICPLFLLMW